MAFNIPLSLDRDFELQLTKLATKYGERFEYLNGLHSTQLNFSSFIDNFIDKTTTADASIDSNANASARDVRSLMNEMSKPQLKLFCFNKLYYELNCVPFKICLLKPQLPGPQHLTVPGEKVFKEASQLK